MTRKDVRGLLIGLAAELLDPPMSKACFRRRQKALVFSRPLEGAGRRAVLVDFAFHPPYDRSADAHLYPRVHLILPEVDHLVAEMMGEGVGEGTLNLPLDLISPKDVRCSWYISGEAEAREAVSELGERLGAWAVPFFDDFRSVEAYADGIERGDERLQITD